jgi:ubiquinone biosynthesis protein
MGAALILATDRTGRLFWLSSTLFFSASFLGLWLIVSILRSGRLR